MLRIERVLILKQDEGQFHRNCKDNVEQARQRKMTAQLLAQLLQGLQNMDVGVYNISAQSFCFKKKGEKFGDQAWFPGSLLIQAKLCKFQALRNGP